MFPLSIQGQFEVPRLTSKETGFVTMRLFYALEAAKASSLHRDGDTITFRGGMFRLVSNWNVLGPVSHGVIKVSATPTITVQYSLSSIELLVVATLQALLAGFCVSIKTGEIGLLNFAVAAFAWTVLFGLNYLVAASRLPAFIRQASGVK